MLWFCCLGKGLVLEAESWGLLLGLRVLTSYCCDQLIVECDLAILVDIANKGQDDFHPLKTMIDCYKVLQVGFSKSVVQHNCNLTQN